MKRLSEEIIILKQEEMLLCDKKQQYSEEIEMAVLVGRINWKEAKVDEATGKVVKIDHSQVVKLDGKWSIKTEKAT